LIADLCCGDPATDLAIAWLAFDERGRAAFRGAASKRHPLDNPIWDRALGWAISLGLLCSCSTASPKLQGAALASTCLPNFGWVERVLEARRDDCTVCRRRPGVIVIR
jgi:hypothetical protein